MAHIVHQIALTIEGNAADDEDYDNADYNVIEHFGILFLEHLVHHILDNPRQIGRTASSDSGADGCTQAPEEIGLNIF